MDGASNSKRDGVGIVLIKLDNAMVEKEIKLSVETSNNEVEYEALIIGLYKDNLMGANHLEVYCDSLLVSNQVTGDFNTKDEMMEAYIPVV